MFALLLATALLVTPAPETPPVPEDQRIEVCATDKPGGDPGVTCCCNTRNGICCAETAYCGMFVPGCMCSR